MTRVMPEPILRANTANFTLGHLIFSRADRQEKAYWRGDTATWVCGHRLPPFQRPEVWTTDQKIKFVESAWLGLHLGTYVINRNEAWAGDRPHPFDLWLIDGRQRLGALDDYLSSMLPVFGYRWGELPELEKRRFDSIPFPQSTVHEGDEATLRELYNRLNFGGTAHTEDQRA